MTTITRQQLRDAIEAGITAASERPSFRDEYATALRKVGAEASEVARGEFRIWAPDGSEVRCPVAQAFPDWSGLGPWLTGGGFCTEFDASTYEAIGEPAYVLQVTDDDSTEGGAA